jgi:histidinol-phosphate aminotransferase
MPELVPFVAPEALEARLDVKFRLRMGANESAFGPSPLALEAMRSVPVSHYGDPQSLALREALGARYEVETDRITVGAGIDELLILLCRAFVDPGDRVVTSLGSYPTFEFAAMGAGGEMVRVRYREDAPHLEALAEAARAVGAKVVYLANPDNPSASFFPPKEIAQFQAALPERCLLLLDEAYADFVPDSHLVPIDDWPMVRLRTFSKAHGLAGARVGFTIGAPEIGRALDKVRPHFGVNAVGQAGALAALGDHTHLQNVIAATHAGRQQLAQIAGEAGLPPRFGWTNFVLMDAESKTAADALLDRLLKAGVFVRKPGQPPLDRYIRVSVGRAEQNTLFGEVLRQIV